MFIIKYALKSIIRSIGRNILIALIVLIIATAACVAMSIQQAAESAAANSLKGMSIAGQVNIDKKYLYEAAKSKKGTEDMRELMPEMNDMMKKYALSLDDMEDYASIKKDGSDDPLVKTYYYSAAISVNGNDDLEKYDLSSSSTSSTEATVAATEAPTEAPTMPAPTAYDKDGNLIEIEMPTMQAATQADAPPQGNEQQMEKPGDFNLLGYNAYAGLEEVEKFGNDSNSSFTLKEGKFFEDNTSEYECVIEESLQELNGIKVDDSITIVNPKNEDETYSLKVVGIFDSNVETMASGDDAYNTIITSYAVVKDIETKSAETNGSSDSSTTSSTASSATTAATEAATTAATSTDSSGSDSDSDEAPDALISQFTGVFIFADIDHYNEFKTEVESRDMDDEEVQVEGVKMYIVTSNDVASFEEGLKPLQNLKNFATTFLYLILAIGAIVLIVISVISIRDRKYEIGVLAAMGIKKFKLSMMFMIEVLTITLIAIIIGAAVGSAASVPVTNSLLSTQVDEQIEENESKQGQQMQPGMEAGKETPKNGEVTGDVEYVDKVDFSVDIVVILKMLGIGILLAVVSGFTSILFILRYDPKQILANRD